MGPDEPSSCSSRDSESLLMVVVALMPTTAGEALPAIVANALPICRSAAMLWSSSPYAESGNADRRSTVTTDGTSQRGLLSVCTMLVLIATLQLRVESHETPGSLSNCH